MFAPLLSVLSARGDTVNTCPVNEKVTGLWTVSVARFANTGFQLFVLHVGSSGILQHFLFCHLPNDHLLHKYVSDACVPGTGEYKNGQSDKSLSECTLQSDGNLPWSLTGGRSGLKILNLLVL